MAINAGVAPGVWLRRQRKSMDLTLEALARRVGCATVTLRKIESGELRPSRDLATRIAEVLNLPPEQRPEFVAFARGAAGHNHFAIELVRAPNNLPASAIALIGRDADLAAIRARLAADGVRMLTLIGPPGVGKTQLALRVAHDLMHVFDDGVFWVSLEAVRAPADVAVAIAHALNLNIVIGSPVELQLKAFLHDKHMLLVLDNFEHVLEAAVFVSDLLASCAYLSVLVTSRAPLRIRAERQYAVPPLAIPDPDHAPTAPADELPAAVKLFLERAQSANPGFALSTDNIEAVCGLCWRLEGLPLAIELVASKAGVASPAELVERLDRHRLTLSGGWRDMPQRHHTLHAAIDWSYRLLTPEQRDLYANLAAFPGAFPASAVEPVCGRGAGEALGGLIDESLVMPVSTPAEPRYRLLAPVREDALERLRASGREHNIRERHAAHYLALAQSAAARLRGPTLSEGLSELESAHENLRAALAWSLAGASDAELALKLSTALWWFWHMHGHLGEGRHWLARALKRGAHGTDLLRARALLGMGVLAWYQGDFDEADHSLTECETLLRDLPQAASAPDRAVLLSATAMLASFRADRDAAARASSECEVLARELGDAWLISLNKNAVARARMLAGDVSAARAELEQALALGRELDDAWLTATPLANLGGVLMELGQAQLARAALEESVALCERIGERWLRALALQLLGQVAQHEGDLPRSAAAYRQALRLSRELGLQLGAVQALNGLNRVAQLQDDFERAAAPRPSDEQNRLSEGRRPTPGAAQAGSAN